MIIYKDKYFNFYELFNESNGTLLRTNIIDNGKETSKKPFKRSYPELIDVGIMGHCSNERTCLQNGIHCYQGNQSNPNMKFADFKRIIKESRGKTFQVALGGKGDPNKHEQFEKILKYSRRNGIVPNLTTSGYNITKKEIKLIIKYCGAVAISCYSKILTNGKESNPQIFDIANQFAAKIKTNIHFVVSKITIKDAILRLRNNLFPKNINGVIFLLYKPVGFGKAEQMIEDDKNLDDFFKAIFTIKHNFSIGFDSCFSNILMNSKYKIYVKEECIQSCESGRFSCYISPDMKMYPCSFAQCPDYMVDLNITSIEYAWFSEKIKSFLKLNKNNCFQCPIKLNIIK